MTASSSTLTCPEAPSSTPSFSTSSATRLATSSGLLGNFSQGRAEVERALVEAQPLFQPLEVLRELLFEPLVEMTVLATSGRLGLVENWLRSFSLLLDLAAQLLAAPADSGAQLGRLLFVAFHGRVLVPLGRGGPCASSAYSWYRGARPYIWKGSCPCRSPGLDCRGRHFDILFAVALLGGAGLHVELAQLGTHLEQLALGQVILLLVVKLLDCQACCLSPEPTLSASSRKVRRLRRRFSSYLAAISFN